MLPFAILGCFILLVGWYGFNPGSELAADAAIGGIAVTTTAAGAMGALAAMATVWIKTGKPDVGMTGNGLLAGLVGITAGLRSGHPSERPSSSAGSPGVLVVFAVDFFDRVLKVDDPVGAVSVHGVCGAFGTLCVGLFAREDVEGFWKQGLFYGGGTDQLVSQLIGVVADRRLGVGDRRSSSSASSRRRSDCGSPRRRSWPGSTSTSTARPATARVSVSSLPPPRLPPKVSAHQRRRAR